MNYKNLKFCKILLKKEIEDEQLIYCVNSIEFCFDTKEGIYILTGDYAGTTIPSVFKTNETDQICGWIEKPENTQKYVATEDLDEIREFLENNLVDRYYSYDSKSKTLEPYQDNYFMDDSIREIEEQQDGLSKIIPVSLKLSNSNQLNLSEIEMKIRDKVINQDETIRKALIAVYGNQKIFASNLSDEKKRQLKNSILIFGSTGTGKTEIIRQIANEIDIPITIEDATRYTVAGYVGSSIDDMIKNLVKRANDNIAKAQRGIIVIDEIDKKRKNEKSSGVTSENVQQSLLKLIEGSIFDIEEKEGYGKHYTFDSSFVTIILCGAFSDLLNCDNEISTKPIGFNNKIISESIKRKYQPEDFIKYGMIPELMGRVSIISKTNDLSKDDIKRIITSSEISPLKLKSQFYNVNNTNINYDEDFIDMIAEKVIQLKTGARGIKLVLDQYLDSVDFEVLSGNLSGIELTKDGLVRKRIKNQNQPEAKEFTN